MLADDARDLDARAVGHVHVHQDQVRIELLERVQRLARVVDDLRHDLVFLQRAPDQVAGGLGILHDQHAVCLLLVPLVQFHDVLDDGMRGRAFQQATVAAAAQCLLQLFEVGPYAETDQLSHSESLSQRLDAGAPLGFGQAAHVEQQERGDACAVRQILVPGDESDRHAEIAELCLQAGPIGPVLRDQPGLADAYGCGRGVVSVLAVLDQPGRGRGVGVGHACKRADALAQVVQRRLRQRMPDFPVEQCKCHLLELVAGVMQGRDAFVDQEFGEAVDGNRQFHEAFKARFCAISMPRVRHGLIFLQELFGGAKH